MFRGYLWQSVTSDYLSSPRSFFLRLRCFLVFGTRVRRLEISDPESEGERPDWFLSKMPGESWGIQIIQIQTILVSIPKVPKVYVDNSLLISSSSREHWTPDLGALWLHCICRIARITMHLDGSFCQHFLRRHKHLMTGYNWHLHLLFLDLK